MELGTAPVSPRAPVIVGRDAVLARLRALAGDGEPAVNVVALVGAAGHGKTRIARALAELMRQRGRLVMEGHARASTAALPLGVFQDALRAARRGGAERDAPEDPLARAFPRQLLPELRAGDAMADERGLLFESACAYFRALGARAGVLVVLEDLHWADPSSLELVAYLAEAVRGSRVLLAVTYRPEEAPSGSALADLRSELLRTRLADELELPVLDEPAVAEMLGGILGSAPDPLATETVFSMSGGVPFFVEEIVREAVTSGQLDPSSGAWRAGGALHLPRTVSDLLLARARRLAEEDRGLLRWAAVIGERIDVRLLLDVSDLGEELTLTCLTRLRDAGLLREDPTDPEQVRLLFRHALTRQAVLDELLAVERRRRHARILEAAEALYAGAPDAPLEELADHALAAGAADRAFRYSLDAALRSLELCGYPEARANFERALERWEPAFGVEARAVLLLAYGRMLARVFRDGGSARALLEEARATYLCLGDRVPAALALAASAFSRVYSGDRAGILDELVAARDELRPDDPPDVQLEVLPLLADALWRAGDFRRMADVAAEGLALVPPEPTRRQLLARIQLLTMLGTSQWLTGDADAARTTLSESYGLARGHHDHLGAGWACLELASLHVSRRAPDAARWADEGIAVSREGGVPWSLVWCTTIRAVVHVKQGQWELAEERLAEGERNLPRLGPDPMCRLGLAWVRAERLLGIGAFHEALADLERTLPEIDSLGDLLVSTRARSALARARVAVDDPAGAREALQPVMRGWAEASAPPLPTAPSLLLTAVEVACAVGDAPEAQRHARELAARGVGARADYALALAAAASGRPGPPGAAEAAAVATDALGWHFDAARMRLLVAEALARAGESEEATALAGGALAHFRDMASDGWCQRAEGVLRGLGLRPPTRPRQRGGLLSARELEVLQLLATGTTNRGIAKRLFISEKTAGHHVASIFAKLDVHSRAQAVNVAAQRSLIRQQTP